jgi:hypothetical protein
MDQPEDTAVMNELPKTLRRKRGPNKNPKISRIVVNALTTQLKDAQAALQQAKADLEIRTIAVATFEAEMSKLMRRVISAEERADRAERCIGDRGTRPAKKARIAAPEAVEPAEDNQEAADSSSEGEEHEEREEDEEHEEDEEREERSGREEKQADREDEVEIDLDQEDPPPLTLRMNRRTKRTRREEAANAFLYQAWLSDRRSFEKLAAETYIEYRAWCSANAIRFVMSHRALNAHFTEIMPVGYKIGRGNGNRATVTFSYRPAMTDLKDYVIHGRLFLKYMKKLENAGTNPAAEHADPAKVGGRVGDDEDQEEDAE